MIYVLIQHGQSPNLFCLHIFSFSFFLSENLWFLNWISSNDNRRHIVISICDIFSLFFSSFAFQSGIVVELYYSITFFSNNFELCWLRVVWYVNESMSFVLITHSMYWRNTIANATNYGIKEERKEKKSRKSIFLLIWES